VVLLLLALLRCLLELVVVGRVAFRRVVQQLEQVQEGLVPPAAAAAAVEQVLGWHHPAAAAAPNSILEYLSNRTVC
jgi:hypothetical protein